MEGVFAKNLEVTRLFVNFSKAFNSIYRGKMEQIILAYGLPKETDAAIMMLCKHESKSSLTGWRHRLLWHCRRCAARRYISLHTCLLSAKITYFERQWFNERKWLYFGKRKKQTIHPRTITDADYADDIALLANTPTQAEYLLHSLERATGGIVPHVNADKTEFMCFNQIGHISTLNGRSLKLEDKFTYLRSSVSSTENDINTRLAKAWTATDRL